MWIDTHAHVNFKAFAQDWREVVDRAVKAGVKKMIVVGADLESSRRAVELAQEHPALWAAVGIHPHHARSINSIESVKSIRELAQNPRVVAIGENGLDYHVYQNSKYPSTALRTSDKQLQRQLFEAQLKLAQELDKPIIFHSRECGEEVLEIIKHQETRNKKQIRGVFHCFGGSKKYVRKILDAGFYVSFTGQITYVSDRASVAAEVPMDKLLVETDCPFMAPEPKRSQGITRSEPGDVIIIGQCHAQARGLQAGQVEAATTANAEALFEFKE